MAHTYCWPGGECRKFVLWSAFNTYIEEKSIQRRAKKNNFWNNYFYFALCTDTSSYTSIKRQVNFSFHIFSYYKQELSPCCILVDTEKINSYSNISILSPKQQQNTSLAGWVQKISSGTPLGHLNMVIKAELPYLLQAF